MIRVWLMSEVGIGVLFDRQSYHFIKLPRQALDQSKVTQLYALQGLFFTRQFV